MMVEDNHGQGSIDLLLVVGIVIVLATVAGLILKGLTNTLQGNAANLTNTLINKTN